MAPTASRSSSSAARRPPAGQSGGDAGAPRTLRPLVEWLTGLAGEDGGWVVSCYLKLEPRDRSRRKYLIKVKNRMRERLEWLERRQLPRAEREAVARDLERIRAYLEHTTNLSHGRGIALFASEALDLFEAVPLPRVFRSRLAVDRTPLVRELAALDDEFGRILCAVYDRTVARFFIVTARDVAELSAVRAEDATRAGRFHGGRYTPGVGGVLTAAGEHNYHQRIQEEKHRHYARIAQRLFDLSRERPVRGIVLGGVGAEADAVRSHLHPYLEDQVLGSTRLNPKNVTPSQVVEAVLAVRRERERAWEAEHVGALEEARGTGWGLNGVEPCLRALSRGQARMLLVDPTVELPGWRCTLSERLTTVVGGCAGEGEAEPVFDVIDEAIEDALRQGAHVEVVEDGGGLRERVHGLGALLRFTVP